LAGLHGRILHTFTLRHHAAIERHNPSKGKKKIGFSVSTGSVGHYLHV
jgi:hypothetical protein